jgi:uncharacterized membrane-anchored protein
MSTALTKLKQLYRPKDGRFWLMIALNALSTVFMFFLQNSSLTGIGRAVLSVVVLVNGGLGMWLMWQLANEPLKKVVPAEGASENQL